MEKIQLNNQINQNGIIRSSSSETEENGNIKVRRSKHKVIRKPDILNISSFDKFNIKYLLDNTREATMEIFRTDKDGNKKDEDVFKCVMVKFSDRTDKKYKLNNKRKSRREKIEDLRRKSVKEYGEDIEENTLFLNMLESYDSVLGDDIFQDYDPTCHQDHCHDDESRNCGLKKRTLSEYEKEAFMRRDLVLTELVDSEKNYKEDLEFIVTKYIPLMTEENVSDEVLKICDDIYMNISDIYEFHYNHFHKKIEDCFENPALLDETFSYYEEQLTSLYTFYCSNKPFADEIIDNYEEELDALRNEKFPDVKLRIKDFLIKPVQRLMKYQLLLSSIRKYGVKAGKDGTYLNTSIEVMARVPKEANDAMHVGLISGFTGCGCNAQQLMIHGELDVSVGKSKPRPVHVFLFETVLLFTEKASKLVPEYKCIDSQDTGTLGYTDNKDNKFVIWFRKHNKTDLYICEADSIEEKENWVAKVKDVMGLKEITSRRMSVRKQLTIEITNDRASPEEKFQTLMIEEAVIKAMAGHPRLGIMTDRLKSNIEKYIASEFIIPRMELENVRSPLCRSRTNPHITNSNSLDAQRDRGRSVSPHSTSKLSLFGIKRSISPSPRRKDTMDVKSKDDISKRSRGKSVYWV